MPYNDPSQQFRNSQDLGAENINYLKGLTSGYSGINNIGDVRRTFGLTDASQAFDPMKKALAASRGAALNQSVRSAGRSATPGMSNTGVDSSFAAALQQLLGQQGQANLGQQQFGANLLGQSFGAKDMFGLNKGNALTGAINQFGNQAMKGREFDASQEGPGFGDIMMSILGGAAKGIAPGAGGALGKSLFGENQMAGTGGGGGSPVRFDFQRSGAPTPPGMGYQSQLRFPR